MIINLDKDSIYRQLQRMPDDTNKVLTYITLGQQYEENQPDSSIYFYRQAKGLSEKINYTNGMLKYISNYTAVLNVQGKYAESLKLNLQAVDISKKIGSRPQMIAAFTNTGAVYQQMDNKQQALTWYLQALPLMEAEGDEQRLATFCSNLCVLYMDLRQYDKALAFGKRSLQLAEKNNDPYVDGMASNNLGDVYLKINDLEQAFRYFRRTYEIGRSIQSLYYQESALLGMGAYYMKKDMPHKYMPVLREALPLADSVQDIKGKVNALMGIGLAHYLQKYPQKAADTLKLAVELAKQYNIREILQRLYLNLSDVYISMGKLRAADSIRQMYDALQTELLNEAVVKNVQELETKYQVQQHQNELLQKNLLIEKKNLEASRQRNWLAAAIGGIILLSFLIFFIYRFYKQKIELDKQQMEALKTEQENVRLKAIVEGQVQERQRISQEMHDDMGSGLTSIVFLSHALNKPSADINVAEIAGKLGSTAASLMEKMNEIIWMMNDQHDELTNLIGYIRTNAAELCENADIDYRFIVPENIPPLHLKQKFRRNVYLVVKEAVHNAVKHAEATSISVEVEINHELLIRVRDNGKGINLQNPRVFSNGLRNMKQRAEDIGGEVTIYNEHGATVQLIAPLV